MSGKRKNSDFFAILWAACAFALAGCGEFSSSPGGGYSLGPLDVSFALYANDMAKNDSAAAHLSTGVLMPVQPGGSYALSFDADKNRNPPNLQIFRLISRGDSLYVGSRIRNIEASDSLGRWIYRFDSRESEQTYWAPILVDKNAYYSGPVKNLLLEGSGNNSTHFSLNLIIAGAYGGTSDSVSEDSLSKLLLRGFRDAYAYGGISIDTIYLHRASERSDLSMRYPDDIPHLAGKSSPDYFLSELGGWPDSDGENTYNALDLVLVHRIEMPGVLGYSVLFGGNMGGGTGSTVVVGTHYYVNHQTEYPQSSAEIVETAIHETGHFFGLRHTTSTSSDMEASGDFSNVEDGITDTPHCGLVIRADIPSGLPKLPLSATPRQVLSKANALSCPDEGNPMFPTVSASNVGPFTKGQLSLIKRNLQLYPH